MRKRTFWYVRPRTTQISLRIRAVFSESSLSAWRDFPSLIIQIRPVKILIRLRECAGWSESSLGAYARRYVWRCGLFLFSGSMSSFVSGSAGSMSTGNTMTGSGSYSQPAMNNNGCPQFPTNCGSTCATLDKNGCPICTCIVGKFSFHLYLGWHFFFLFAEHCDCRKTGHIIAS